MASLNTIELDFSNIKENLKDFMRSQSEFTDFDFEGSGWSYVLDVLAYTTHYMGVHANLSINEIFMDSASLRNSVVSRAKELGYFPRQRNASTAIINLSVTPGDSPASIIVDKGTKLTCELDGVTYQFVTPDSYTMTDQGGGVYSLDMTIAQGLYNTQEYVYDASNLDQRFIISQNYVDDTYMSVNVKDSPSSGNITAWVESTTIAGLDGTSQVHFRQEVEDERIEVYFGDGVLGEALINNNVVQIEYLTTSGKDANGCSVFGLVNDIGTYLKSEFTISLVSKADGGADAESIESIKHLAPKSYQMQGRAVIVDDYKTLLLSSYGDIETISVWGGENAEPPQYGKVFISIKPISGAELSPASKEFIQTTILDQYNVVGIIPELIDPEYTYIDVVVNATYEREKTTLAAGQLQTLVQDAIDTYFADNVTKFDTLFRYSNFIKTIDDADESILNNLTDITLKQIRKIRSGINTYTQAFNNAIDAESLNSDPWVVSTKTYQIKDDGLGEIHEYVDGIKGNSVGDIDYNLGKIDIKTYDFAGAANGTDITFHATPTINDISTVRNTLLIAGDISITMNFIE